MVLATAASYKNYPAPLRRIRYFDLEQQRFFIFLSNNFDLPALTIAQLYRARWKVELFFNWIKQHLCIKSMLRHQRERREVTDPDRHHGLCIGCDRAKGTWLSTSLYQILQVVSVTIFERMPILQALQPEDNQEKSELISNQLNLWRL